MFSNKKKRKTANMNTLFLFDKVTQINVPKCEKYASICGRISISLKLIKFKRFLSFFASDVIQFLSTNL